MTSTDSDAVSYDEDFKTLVSLFPYVPSSSIKRYLLTFTSSDRLALISNLLIDYQENDALFCKETNESALHSSNHLVDDVTRDKSPSQLPSISLDVSSSTHHLKTDAANSNQPTSPRNTNAVKEDKPPDLDNSSYKGGGLKRLSTKSFSSAVQWLTEVDSLHSSSVNVESSIKKEQDSDYRIVSSQNQSSPRKGSHVSSLDQSSHRKRNYVGSLLNDPDCCKHDTSVVKETESCRFTGTTDCDSVTGNTKSCLSKPTLRINGFGFDFGKAKKERTLKEISPKRSAILVQDDDLPKAKLYKDESPLEDWKRTEFCVQQFLKRFPRRFHFELNDAKDLCRHIQCAENQLFSTTYDKSDDSNDDEDKWCYHWYWRATNCLNNVGKKFEKWSQEKIEQLYNIHSENPGSVKIMLRREKKIESFQVHFWSMTMKRGHDQWYISRLKFRKNTADQQQPARKDEFDCVYPNTWQPQNEDSVVFHVKVGGPEWNDVVGLFTRSIPQYCAKVIDVQRVQNKWLWKKFYIRKKLLTEKNGRDNVNEKRLFHGTSQIQPCMIWKGEEGFDSRFSRDGMWGKGSYFAESSGYSACNYAHVLPNNTRQIFLANVLTGFNCELMPDNTLTMPPVRMTDSAGIQVRYNSVSGWTHGSKIYIVYQLDFAYPSYLITYSFGMGTNGQPG